jgi:4-amino-4-deoxy-L-arabinose transferase-like glycosyltransferase
LRRRRRPVKKTIRMARRLRRIPDGAVALVVALGVFAIQLPFRLHWVNLTDEGAILQDAVDILAGRRMYVDAIHPAFPGVFYLTAAAFALGGATFDTARVLACAIFAAAVASAYRIGRWWLRPLGALALVVLLVDYRVWAFPHWQMLSYSSLAVALLLGATALVGAAFASGRPATYVAAGAVAALAMVTKQDSGVLGTAALGAAILLVAPEPPGRRLSAALHFVAGATGVFTIAVVAISWAGMMPGLIRHTIVAPLHGLQQFAYQGSPALWPLVGQDAAMRAHAGSYFPTILVDVYFPQLVGSRLYRETGWLDLAIRLAYHLPWLVVVLGAAVLVRRPRPDDRAAVVRRARERLVLLLALGCWLAFNRPHDWIHLFVLYPPTLLVASLLVARPRGVAGGAMRVAVVLGLAALTVASARVARDFARVTATPVTSPRGVIYARPPQAASLQALVDALAVAAPPDVPLASMPYHPLVNFISARAPLTPYYSIWPGEPDVGRTATVQRALDARPEGLVVYNQSQVPHFEKMWQYTPALFAYLADHYRIAQVVGGQPFGYEFLVLRREPPPFGRPLDLARAGVRLVGSDGAARDATPAERGRLVGEAAWPFQRVLRVDADAGATTEVRLPVAATPTARVFTSYGVNPDMWSRLPRHRPRFAIAVATDGGETIVAEATLDPLRNLADRRWVDVTVDLAPWAGRSVELVLRVATAVDGTASTDRTGFGEPRLVP